MTETRVLAETYDRVSDQQLASGKRLVERLQLPPGARVLDVGCGTGRLAHWLASRADVTGLDPSPERIAIARETTSTARFHVGSAEDLSAFPDAGFDAVVMSAVLHWVADKPRALAEARRVLAPGGRLGVTTVPAELSRAPGTLRAALDPLLARAGLAVESRGTTTTELVALVLAARLDLVELHLAPATHTHATGEAVVAFAEASAFGTFLRAVPEELRPQLRAELVAALDARATPAGVALRTWGTMFIATPS